MKKQIYGIPTKENNDAEDAQYENLSMYIADRVAKKKAEGFVEGFARGFAKGIAKARLSAARELYQMGFDIQMISKVTKLPVNIVTDLLNN